MNKISSEETVERLDGVKEILKKFADETNICYEEFNNGMCLKYAKEDEQSILYLSAVGNKLFFGTREFSNVEPRKHDLTALLEDELNNFVSVYLETTLRKIIRRNEKFNEYKIKKTLSSNKLSEISLYDNTDFYSVTYSNVINSFSITNIPKELDEEYKKSNEYAMKCVARNLLLCGSKAKIFHSSKTFSKDTQKLYSQFIKYTETLNNNKPVNTYLFDNENVCWDNTIQGGMNSNPALDFYSRILPEYLGKLKNDEQIDYTFVPSMIMPEASFSCIIPNPLKNDNKMALPKQFVDFYLPLAHLVIEIDGIQHKNAKDRMNDAARDKLLKKYGNDVIRISTDEIKDCEKLNAKLEAIKVKLDTSNEIQLVKTLYDNGDADKTIYLMEAALRFEILLLEILKNQRYNELEKININFINTNEEYQIPFELAYESVKELLENLYVLADIDMKVPEINMSFSDRIENESINIDFNLYKHYDEMILNNGIYQDIIYVRNAYCDNIDYFKLDLGSKIEYNFITNKKQKEKVLTYFLENIFGYSNYKNGQKEIIENTLSGKTTIGILPTGTGKSLCYQLCALLEPCISFAIAPIQSLIIDQKRCFDEIGYDKTNYIISTIDAYTKDEILNNFGNARYLLIWISPERFQTKTFREQLRQLGSLTQFGIAVVDEVHCLSEWGHDFRTSYLTVVPSIKKYCGEKTTLLGLTATASQFVIKDLIKEFDTNSNAIKALASLDRDELCFYVVKTADNGELNDSKLNTTPDDNIVNEMYDNITSDEDEYEDDEEVSKYNIKFGDLFDVLRLEYGKNAGIIFEYYAKNCVERRIEVWNEVVGPYWDNIDYDNDNDVYESFANHISIFNGQMDARSKEINLYEYINNITDLMIATKAFGMGINKTNIKYTIHNGLPQSLESFYQEAGRAGRDNDKSIKSHCYIVYTPETNPSTIALLDKLFDITTKKKEINDISARLEGDLNKIFVLYKMNHYSIEEQVRMIVNYLIQMFPIGTGMVKNNQMIVKDCLFERNKNSEQALYKLAILGIVKDWTIEKWFDGRLYDVKYSTLTPEEIETNLIDYISKYDPEFEIDMMKKGEDIYKEYRQFFDLNSEAYKIITSRVNMNMVGYNDFEKILPYILCLLQWQEDNITYNQRQNIKTMMDLCNNYTTSAKMKAVIDAYFKYNKDTISIDKLIKKDTKNYNAIMSVFFERKRDGMKQISNRETTILIDDDRLYQLNGIITRYIESYRRNTTLDYLCGVVRLLLSDEEERLFDKQTENRLKRLFEREKKKDTEKYYDLVIKTLYILKSREDCDISNYEKLFDEYEDATLLNELYRNTGDEYFRIKIFKKASMNFEKMFGNIKGEKKSKKEKIENRAKRIKNTKNHEDDKKQEERIELDKHSDNN